MPSINSFSISNAGTAFLALAVLEFLYKTIFQKELLSDIVSQLKLAIAIPVDAVYLRRRELPQGNRLPEALNLIHGELYIKAISYTIVLTEGLGTYLPKTLAKNPNLRIRFLILDPDTSLMPSVSKLTGLAETQIIQSINSFQQAIEELKVQFGDRVDYAFYSSIPSCSVWVADPDKPSGWIKVEPIIFNGQAPSDRLNLFFRRSQDPEYFLDVFEAIKREWNSSVSSQNNRN